MDRRRKSPKFEKEQVIAGRKPVLEMIESGQSIESVFILNSIRGELEKTLRKACQAHKIPFKPAPKQFFRTYDDVNHQGVVAIKGITRYYSIDALLSECQPRGKYWFILMLEGITDVRNLGAIARSAEVFGVDAIVLPMKNVAPVNSDSQKTSAGAINRVKLVREKSIPTAIKLFKKHAFHSYGTHLSATMSIQDVEMKQNTLLIMGSEEHGISSETIKNLDQEIIIPQVGKTDSLNVSVATGICLYEFLKLRQIDSLS